MSIENHEEENKPKPITLSHCKHDSGLYSLSMDIEDRHISVSADSYKPHTMGYGATISIFDLTPPDMIALAHAILKEGFAIQPQWERQQERERKLEAQKEKDSASHK